jgi:putative flippase GtrA
MADRCPEPEARRIVKFVIGGAINTGTSYLAYLLLQTFLQYQIAYGLAYALGIVLAYYINARHVFSIAMRLSRFLMYPLVYLAIYLMSAVLLHVCVAFIGIRPMWAPIAVALVMVPVSFLINRFALGA